MAMTESPSRVILLGPKGALYQSQHIVLVDAVERLVQISE